MSEYIEKEKIPSYSLKKGIWVIGDSGVGKTKLLQGMCKVSMNINKRRIKSYEAQSFVENYRKTGLMPKIPERLDCLIDDIGLKEYVPHFGDYDNPIAWLIRDRSKRQESIEHQRFKVVTHFTSMFSPSELMESGHYDYHVHSRLVGMSNIFYLCGENQRIN